MEIVRRAYGAESFAVGERQVRVICSTAEVDRAGDVVVQAGIDLSAYRRNPVVLWNHDPEQPIARALEIGLVDGRLQALVQFPPEGVSARADEVHGLVKAGVVNATSVGFMPLDAEPLDKAKPYRGQRFLKSELMEFSFVSVPANRGAVVVARRAPLLKDLREVGVLAELFRQLASLADCVADEAAVEQDGSPMPARLSEALASLGQILVDMTAEEVGEMLVEVQEPEPDAEPEPEIFGMEDATISELTSDVRLSAGRARRHLRYVQLRR